jgi:hypothetical protein
MEDLSILFLPCTRASSIIGGLLRAWWESKVWNVGAHKALWEVSHNIWRVSWDKRKEGLKQVFLDDKLYWNHADTHTAQHQVDPYWNKSHVPELSFHLMQWKICQYSVCLAPGLDVFLVSCWELGEKVRCPMWVFMKHFEKFPRVVESLVRKSGVQCGFLWSTLRSFLVYLHGSS